MQDNTIGTSNTQLASFLVAKGHQVARTSQNAGSTLFHFIATPWLTEDAQSLKFGNDMISARALFSARSYLLSLIHNDEGFQ